MFDINCCVAQWGEYGKPKHIPDVSIKKLREASVHCSLLREEVNHMFICQPNQLVLIQVLPFVKPEK